ncbi:TPA: MFS transporter [Raoultella planticola]|nr:MFS transporter [Raoultella planticola]
MHKFSPEDIRYEKQMVLMLALLFGVVGLDRLVVVYLFPILIPALGLSNSQAGAIASMLALSWALSSWGLGNLSDRIGRKKVLIFSSAFFSLMTCFTGIAKSFGEMLIIRGLLGVGEGGVFSSSVAAISDFSRPEKKGINLGIHQSFFPLLGIGLGPIIATQMSGYMSWHWIFFILGVPGLAITFWLIRSMKPTHLTYHASHQPDKKSVWQVFHYRNIWLATIIGSLFQSGFFVFSTFITLYLTQIKSLPLPTAGFIVSGWGFGGFIGMIFGPAVSDYIGRRMVLVSCSMAYGILMLAFVLYTQTPVAMFTILFIAGIFGFSVAPLFLAIIPGESVPSNMIGAAVGVPTAISELVGGVLMPIIAGGIADHIGLKGPILIVGGVSLACAAVGLLLKETAPRLARAMQISER